jgi:hypothetical protein
MVFIPIIVIMAAHNNVILSLLCSDHYYSCSSCCAVQVATAAYAVVMDWLNEIPFVAYEMQILCLTKHNDWLLIHQIFL